MITDQIAYTLVPPHVHLSKMAIRALFESGKLTNAGPLDQPGLYRAAEMVTVVGPDGQTLELPIFGPSRPKTQVELTAAQADRLGISAAVELSGCGSAGEGVLLRTSFGELPLAGGVLIPQNHIHMPPEDASALGLREGQTITIGGPDGFRADQIAVRVSHMFVTRVHLLDDGSMAAPDGALFVANSGTAAE